MLYSTPPPDLPPLFFRKEAKFDTQERLAANFHLFNYFYFLSCLPAALAGGRGVTTPPAEIMVENIKGNPWKSQEFKYFP